MPVSYTLRVQLAEVSGQLGNVVLEFDSFPAAMTARDKIMAGMTITPELSAPAGRMQAETQGEGDATTW